MNDRLLMSELGREIVERVLSQSVPGVRAAIRDLAANGLPMLRAAVHAEMKGQNRRAVLFSLRGAIKRMEKRRRSRPDPNPAF